MIVGIFAKTFGTTTAQACLEEAARAGYACVQFNMQCAGLPAMPAAIPVAVTEAVLHASQVAGVSIAAVSGTYNMIHPNPHVREQGLVRLAVLAGASAAMGFDLITLCTGSRDPDDQWRFHPDNRSPSAWRDLMADMEKAVAIAEAYNVRLGIEPELANVVSSAEHAKRLIDELRSERVQVVFDPANLFEVATPGEQRVIVTKALGLLGDSIAIAHAKDRSPDGTFTRAGKGVLDYRHYIAGLRAVGFRGPLIAHGLSRHDAPLVAEFLGGLLSTEPAFDLP